MSPIQTGLFYLYCRQHEAVGVAHTEQVSDTLAWRSGCLNSA
jgi:hypothetical protein